MVAITASLPISSQVGATAVRTRSAARANSSASRIQVTNLSQIPRPRVESRFALPDRRGDKPKRLQSAKGDDEHGAGLNEKRRGLGNLLELVVDGYGSISPGGGCGRGQRNSQGFR
jgi:hypothetical protein